MIEDHCHEGVNIEDIYRLRQHFSKESCLLMPGVRSKNVKTPREGRLRLFRSSFEVPVCVFGFDVPNCSYLLKLFLVF